VNVAPEQPPAPIHPSDNKLEARLQAAWPQLLRALHGLHAKAPPSIYSSADIRDAGTKTVAVDTNAFPAGFNNLCRHSRKTAVEALAGHLALYHADARRILLLPEDHTRNPHYLHNVHHLMGILDAAGLEYRVGSADPEVVANVQGITDPPGHTLVYSLVTCRAGRVFAGSDPVDLILSNNDFTFGVPPALAQCGTPIVPDPVLGWDTRRKHRHFLLYNHIATHLAQIARVDDAALRVETEPYGPLDFHRREGIEGLARLVEDMLQRTGRSQERLGIDGEPRVFIKDDAGTYGMGVIAVASGDEVRAMNNRTRQKMDKGKYGHKVGRVIVQEGVPTLERVESHPAELVAYSIGAEPIGAFLRTHDSRGAVDNLNAPGMRFVPLCTHPECKAERPERIARTTTLREELAARIAIAALAHEARPEFSAAKADAEIPLSAVVPTRP
jgi:glutamate--cysteine ligase